MNLGLTEDLLAFLDREAEQRATAEPDPGEGGAAMLRNYVAVPKVLAARLRVATAINPGTVQSTVPIAESAGQIIGELQRIGRDLNKLNNDIIVCGYVAREIERKAAAGTQRPQHPDADGSTSAAARDVIHERLRQITEEGWSKEHDDKHRQGELAVAGAAYAKAAALPNIHPPAFWPWSLEWWKPKDRRRDLVRAAALIIAEIERLDRLSASENSFPNATERFSPEQSQPAEIAALRQQLETLHQLITSDQRTWSSNDEGGFLRQISDWLVTILKGEPPATKFPPDALAKIAKELFELPPVPHDVAALVAAARIYLHDEPGSDEARKALDKAVEAFSTRVPYDDDPNAED